MWWWLLCLKNSVHLLTIVFVPPWLKMVSFFRSSRCTRVTPWFDDDDDEFSIASNRKPCGETRNRRERRRFLQHWRGWFSVSVPVSVPASIRGKGKFWGVGTHVRRCPRFLFSLWCTRFPDSIEHSPSLLQRGWHFDLVVSSTLQLTLGEQFLTPSLESVSIPTLSLGSYVFFTTRGRRPRTLPGSTASQQDLSSCSSAPFLFSLATVCLVFFFYLVISFYGTLVSFLKVKVHPLLFCSIICLPQPL